MAAFSRRIVVTGLGAMSPLGHTAEETWLSARDGRGAIELTAFDPGPNAAPGHTAPAALVKGDTVKALEAALGRRVGASLDRFAVYALKSAHEALAQAGLIGLESLKER